MSKKECGLCFELVDEDVDLCDECEQVERELDEAADAEAAGELDDDLIECAECGCDAYPEDLNGDGLCGDCESDLDEDADDE